MPSVFIQNCYISLYSTENVMCGKKSGFCVLTILVKNMDTLVKNFPGMGGKNKLTIKSRSHHTSLTDADFFFFLCYAADNIDEVFSVTWLICVFVCPTGGRWTQLPCCSLQVWSGDGCWWGEHSLVMFHCYFFFFFFLTEVEVKHVHLIKINNQSSGWFEQKCSLPTWHNFNP